MGGKPCPKSSAGSGQTALTGWNRDGRAKAQRNQSELGKNEGFWKLGANLPRGTQLRAPN